jgi:hypothetical protein
MITPSSYNGFVFVIELLIEELDVKLFPKGDA